MWKKKQNIFVLPSDNGLRHKPMAEGSLKVVDLLQIDPTLICNCGIGEKGGDGSDH